MLAQPAFDVLQRSDGLRRVPELDDRTPRVLWLQGNHFFAESFNFFDKFGLSFDFGQESFRFSNEPGFGTGAAGLPQCLQLFGLAGTRLSFFQELKLNALNKNAARN